MEKNQLIMGMILVAIIAMAIFAIPAIKLKKKLYKETGKFPKGHYLGLGLTIGLAVGLLVDVLVESISLGPAIGVALGLAIGSAWENKNKYKLRDLTAKEQTLKIRMMIILTVFVLLGLAVLFFL
jgi:hypothetical protein